VSHAAFRKVPHPITAVSDFDVVLPNAADLASHDALDSTHCESPEEVVRCQHCNAAVPSCLHSNLSQTGVSTTNGDIVAIARVASEQNTNTFAKAGVMIRASLNTNAAHVILDT
jgi:hypothetical protein